MRAASVALSLGFHALAALGVAALTPVLVRPVARVEPPALLLELAARSIEIVPSPPPPAPPPPRPAPVLVLDLRRLKQLDPAGAPAAGAVLPPPPPARSLPAASVLDGAPDVPAPPGVPAVAPPPARPSLSGPVAVPVPAEQTARPLPAAGHGPDAGVARALESLAEPASPSGAPLAPVAPDALPGPAPPSAPPPASAAERRLAAVPASVPPSSGPARARIRDEPVRAVVAIADGGEAGNGGAGVSRARPEGPVDLLAARAAEASGSGRPGLVAGSAPGGAPGGTARDGGAPGPQDEGGSSASGPGRLATRGAPAPAGPGLDDGAGSGGGRGSRLAALGPGGVPAAYEPYLRALRERVQARAEYPWAARRRRLEGTVELELRLDGQGGLTGVAVVEAGAAEPLREAALQAVRAAAPFPFPAGVPARPLVIRLPVVFALR